MPRAYAYTYVLGCSSSHNYVHKCLSLGCMTKLCRLHFSWNYNLSFTLLPQAQGTILIGKSIHSPGDAERVSLPLVRTCPPVALCICKLSLAVVCVCADARQLIWTWRLVFPRLDIHRLFEGLGKGDIWGKEVSWRSWQPDWQAGRYRVVTPKLKNPKMRRAARKTNK